MTRSVIADILPPQGHRHRDPALRAIATVFLFVLLTRLWAQYPLVRTITAMDGQQGVHATCLAQDAQGLIWLGSDRGLFRTDGDRTDPILRTDGDPVLAVCGTGDGVLTALSSGVVLRCDGGGCDTLWSDTLYRTAPVRSLTLLSLIHI